MSDGAHILTFPEAMKAIIAGLATVAVWLLKKLGEGHLASIEKLNTKLDSLIQRLDTIADRVTIVEVRMKHLEHGKDEK